MFCLFSFFLSVFRCTLGRSLTSCARSLLFFLPFNFSTCLSLAYASFSDVVFRCTPISLFQQVTLSYFLFLPVYLPSLVAICPGTFPRVVKASTWCISAHIYLHYSRTLLCFPLSRFLWRFPVSFNFYSICCVSHFAHALTSFFLTVTTDSLLTCHNPATACLIPSAILAPLRVSLLLRPSPYPHYFPSF